MKNLVFVFCVLTSSIAHAVPETSDHLKCLQALVPDLAGEWETSAVSIFDWLHSTAAISFADQSGSPISIYTLYQNKYYKIELSGSQSFYGLKYKLPDTEVLFYFKFIRDQDSNAYYFGGRLFDISKEDPNTLWKSVTSNEISPEKAQIAVSQYIGTSLAYFAPEMQKYAQQSPTNAVNMTKNAISQCSALKSDNAISTNIEKLKVLIK